MRVVVADDSLLTRAGIVAILREVGCEVVAEARDGVEALAAVRVHRPDVAVLDIRMPPTHTDEGLVAAHEIHAAFPKTAVLVLSQYVEPAYAMRLIETYPGGLGYLLKERVLDAAVLLDALRRLVDGECVIDPTIVAQFMHPNRKPDPLDILTDREREVLAQLAEGRSNSAIAAALYIAERTVESHTTQIFQKLGLESSTDVHRRVSAVLTYLRSVRSGV
jgi:DNA-binding NarL/FixJ family response regulator